MKTMKRLSALLCVLLFVIALAPTASAASLLQSLAPVWYAGTTFDIPKAGDTASYGALPVDHEKKYTASVQQIYYTTSGGGTAVLASGSTYLPNTEYHVRIRFTAVKADFPRLSYRLSRGTKFYVNEKRVRANTDYEVEITFTTKAYGEASVSDYTPNPLRSFLYKLIGVMFVVFEISMIYYFLSGLAL